MEPIPRRQVRRASGVSGALATLVLLAVAGLQPLAAQATGTITGKVTDALTGRPIPDAQVSIAGTSRGTLTNRSGDFLIPGVPVGEATVRVLFIGFSSQSQVVNVASGAPARADFLLQAATIDLDGLVVTGTPGATQRRTVGNTVTSIAAAQVVESAPISRIDELLQGRAPGVTLMTGAGTSGTSGNIKIRGAGSLNAGNRPIFFVDGVRIQSSVGGEFSVLGQSSNPLDHINPEDIESIEVIKGPAASTLYGAEAASGVIQIITKRGTAGQQSIQWSAGVERGTLDWALPQPVNYKVCTPAMIGNAATWPGCQGLDPNASPLERRLSDSPLDRDPLAIREGSNESYRLTVRGGGERFSFFGSGDHDYEKGIFFNNYQKRQSGRMNFQALPLENLDFAVSLAYTRAELALPLNDNASNGLLRNAYRGEPGRAAPWAEGFLNLGPVQINSVDNRRNDERTIIGTTVNFEPRDWFSNRLTLGLDKLDRNSISFTQIDTTGRAPFGATAAAGQISQLAVQNHVWTVDYAGTVSFPINDRFTSAFSAGMQFNSRTFHQIQGTGTGLVSNDLNLIGSAATTSAGETRTAQNSLGVFVQEQIGWRDRLYITGAVRFDDNSAFGENFTWAAYPKLSASYIISEEDFFNFDSVDELKLRMAWGKAGNSPAPFSADRTLEAATVTLADGTSANAVTTDAYGNPDLTAESGQELEVGFDMGLFNGRMGLEATYYNQRTVDALVSLSVPPSSGFGGNQLQNVGEILNAGFEFGVYGTPIATPRFTWEARATLATNKNEMVRLSREPIVFGSFQSVQRHQDGYPLGGYWAADVVRDANGVPVLDANGRASVSTDSTYIGPSSPTREISLTNTFSLPGGLRLYVFADYKGGHYLWSAREWWRSFNQDISFLVNDFEGSTDAERAAYRSGAPALFIDNADFIKLREVSLTWDLPEVLASSVRARNASVSLAGRNLGVWTNYDLGSDPELNFSGDSDFSRTDYMSVPMIRQFRLSFNVNF